MESLSTLLKIFLYIYLGSFSYITFKIIFSFQKRLLVIKTFIFFLFLAILIIKITNKYHIKYSLGYIFFFILGILITRYIFKDEISKNIKVVASFIYSPLSKLLRFIVKKIVFYDLFLFLKKKYKIYKYYKKFPYKKQKTIYELF